jgi:CheY-like chemotaxis protein
VKFTEHGCVFLRVDCFKEDAQSAWLRFEVEDTGIGIAPDILPRLFSAFEQADNSTTRKYGGTGLGLAITKKIAELMDGDAGAESTLGQGSRFWFTACLKKDRRAGHAATVQESSGAEAILKRQCAGVRVLLAEDEPINREITLMLLDEIGLVVDVAEDGLAAVELVDRNDYALILMDMQMPRMDGLEATQTIRRHPRAGKVPIIAMTANAFAEDKARCHEAGMNDFIAKPVNPEVLFATLLKWLTQSEPIIPG